MSDRRPAPTPAAVVAAVDALADPVRAQGAQRFFKTGPGDYAEGDRFVGVPVPQLRSLATTFTGLEPDGVITLLDSPIHEHRLIGLFLLRDGFERSGTDDRRLRWIELYLDAVRNGRVNNWDLVDSSADPILGEWLVDRPRGLLTELAGDDALWTRRVGIVATFAFLRRGDPTTLYEVAPLVIADRRDLIQKAFGWMLREAGKRCDADRLLAFLQDNAHAMGRTALSYASEHLDAPTRAELRARH